MSDKPDSKPPRSRPRRAADQDADEIALLPVVLEVPAQPTPGEHAVSPVRMRMAAGRPIAAGGVHVIDRRARG